MKIFIYLFIATLSFLPAHSQVTTDKENPYIAVTGTAEKLVTPDEIYVKIIIRERLVGKDKIELNVLEQQMIQALKKEGISEEQLTLSESLANYQRIRWFRKDVLRSAEYILKLSTSEEVSKVFYIVDSLQITNASIWKTDYSKRIELKFQLQAEAMKIAQKKANTILNSIEYKAGAPLYVEEMQYNISYRNQLQSNTMMLEMDEPEGYDGYISPIKLEKLEFKYSIKAHFAIVP